MKHFATVLACLVLLVALTSFAAAEKLNIVATNFPCYDLARAVAGDHADIMMLMNPGAENHSWEPKPQDIRAIGNADLFIYVGGENDTWVETILASLEPNVPETFLLTDCVELVEEELVEGMEPEDKEEEEGEEEEEFDEHVWTSPLNAIAITRAMCERFSGLDPEHAEDYAAGCEAQVEKLTALDAAFREVTAGADRHTLIFGDRFPFRYFADAYGLDYYAAFPGCSSDTEASAQTVRFLIDKVKETDTPVVFAIELSQGKIADAICEATGAKKMTLHSCHNVTRDDFCRGGDLRNADAAQCGRAARGAALKQRRISVYEPFDL